MSGAQIALLCGLAVGLGLASLLMLLVRRAPDLAAAMAYLDGAAPIATATDSTGRREQFDRWALQAMGQLSFVKVPHHDLVMIDRTPQWYAAKKMAYAAIGSLYVLIIGGVLTQVMQLSVVVPVFAVLIGAVLGFFLPDASIKRQADRKRAEMRRAVSSYVDLVALARLAGAGGSMMLEAPATTGQGWTFRRIQRALRQGRTSTELPWMALRDLGTEAGISELIDLATTAHQAGEGGSPVAGQLFATGKQLRARVQQDGEKAARKAATEVWVPASLMVIVFLIFLIYPFASRL